MKSTITIVGLGPGGEDEITLGGLKALKRHKNVILRTERHGIVPYLKEQGINYMSLDDMYESNSNFDDVYKRMVKYIFDKADEEDVVLGIPGHPMVGERLVFSLIKEAEGVYNLDIVPGISRAAELISLIHKAEPEGIKVLTALETQETLLNSRIATVIIDIHTGVLASELKLNLLRIYPYDLEMHISQIDGEGRTIVRKLLLYELDHHKGFDHTSCIYIPALSLTQSTRFDFTALTEIMALLRGPEGCPWDKEQTHKSLKQYLIEETYEVLEAIDLNDMDKILEELGDLLLQVVFHAQIAKEYGEFDIVDVITRICRKMIDRHTHIFGDVSVDSADEVVSNWEAIKKQEKGLKSHTQVLRDIPSNLPALMRSYKVQKKAALVGFDWDRVEDAVLKVDEELLELKEVYKGGNEERITDEIGDLLFAVVNVARFLKVQPELALTSTIEKFIRRFDYIEQNAELTLEELSLDEMDALWNRAKAKFSKDLNV